MKWKSVTFYILHNSAGKVIASITYNSKIKRWIWKTIDLYNPGVWKTGKTVMFDAAIAAAERALKTG